MKRTSILSGILAVLLGGCASVQRGFLFYPTHHANDGGLAVWEADCRNLGYARTVDSPRTVWLMLHGNAGQAADRAYALPSFASGDAVYILEYPGYGSRNGRPSMASINAAAAEGYEWLRASYPGKPVGVVGESIGSGPAAMLATRPVPPDKIVLIVPFDKMADVAARHVRFPPAGLILEAKWDNIRSLSGYDGPVEIFAAAEDTVIPPAHARNLADHIPQALFQLIPGGHNDWSEGDSVKIR